MRRLRVGKTPLVVEATASGGVSYHYDPTRPEAPAARDAVDSVLQRAAGRKDPVATLDDRKTEPGGRYIDFLIPGLIGQNTMGGGLWGVGFLLVNFRIGKLLKRFAATPMPRRDFLLAILLARLTFLIPDVAVLLGMGVLVFKMPIVGSLWLVILIEVVGALAFAGIGLLIACRAQTHRDRQRPDEPRDAADVDLRRALLPLGPVPRRDAAVHPGAAPDPAPQRPPPGDARGGDPVRRRHPPVPGHPRGLGRGHLHPGPPLVPLDLSPRSPRGLPVLARLEDRPAEQGRQVVADRPDRGRREVGDVDLLDRLDQERRLGQDLDVQEPRRRLERDLLQGLATMHPDRRIQVGRPARRTAPDRAAPAACGRPFGRTTGGVGR